jgi:hypothetical protein
MARVNRSAKAERETDSYFGRPSPRKLAAQQP